MHVIVLLTAHCHISLNTDNCHSTRSYAFALLFCHWTQSFATVQYHMPLYTVSCQCRLSYASVHSPCYCSLSEMPLYTGIATVFCPIPLNTIFCRCTLSFAIIHCHMPLYIAWSFATAHCRMLLYTVLCYGTLICASTHCHLSLYPTYTGIFLCTLSFATVHYH